MSVVSVADGFTDNATIVEALACIERGWQVFPVDGKKPRTPHGFQDATLDKGTIERWYKHFPNAGLGIRTGAESNLLVLDFDKKTGGLESMHDLERKHGKLPDTVTALSGGGGMHLYYQHPGFEVKPSVGELAKGVDVRADSTYVVAPPSPHKSGNKYEWEGSSHPDDYEPEHAPQWLLDLLHGTRKAAALPRSFVPIPSGNRNNELTRHAGRFATFGYTEEELYGFLKVINESRCEEPLTDKEIRKIISSASKWTPEQPNQPNTVVNVSRCSKVLHREPTQSDTPNTVVNPLCSKVLHRESDQELQRKRQHSLEEQARDNKHLRGRIETLIAIIRDVQYQLDAGKGTSDAYLIRRDGVAQRTGFHATTVSKHFTFLEQHGFIERVYFRGDVVNKVTGEVITVPKADMYIKLCGTPEEVLERAMLFEKVDARRKEHRPFVSEVQKDNEYGLAKASKDYYRAIER